MKITVTGWDEVVAQARDAGPVLKQEIRKAVQAEAMEGVRNIKIAMPVDTGRARASWGSPEAEGIFYYEDDGFTNVQGTNVVYVDELNQGSSKQAPAGFIDAEEAARGESLAERIENILEVFFT